MTTPKSPLLRLAESFENPDWLPNAADIALLRAADEVVQAAIYEAMTGMRSRTTTTAVSEYQAVAATWKKANET